MINKFYIALLTVLALAISVSYTQAQVSEHNNDIKRKYSDAVRVNEDGQIFISTGSDSVTSTSTQITKSEDSFFCNSNVVQVFTNKRLDITDEETTTIFNISASYNEVKIDPFKGMGQPSDINEFFHIGVDMWCREDHVLLFLVGYNDSSKHSGATLVKTKIDIETGSVE